MSAATRVGPGDVAGTALRRGEEQAAVWSSQCSPGAQ